MHISCSRPLVLVSRFPFSERRVLPLSWTMVPLGVAVLCWAASFSCGCRHLQYVVTTMYANMAISPAPAGSHPDNHQILR